MDKKQTTLALLAALVILALWASGRLQKILGTVLQ